MLNTFFPEHSYNRILLKLLFFQQKTISHFIETAFNNCWHRVFTYASIIVCFTYIGLPSMWLAKSLKVKHLAELCPTMQWAGWPTKTLLPSFFKLWNSHPLTPLPSSFCSPLGLHASHFFLSFACGDTDYAACPPYTKRWSKIILW